MCTILTAILLTLATAKEPSSPKPVDVSEVRDSLAAFELESGELFVAQLGQGFEYLFYGKAGQMLYRQEGPGYSGTSTDGFVSFTVRRNDRRYAGYQFVLKDQNYSVHCGEQILPLKRLDPEAAKTALQDAKFVEAFWRRNAHFLARDDHGVYYFVDRALGSDPPMESYRVYMGWVGEVLQAPLKLIAKDTNGEVYGVPGSDQRLVVSAGSARFLDGEKTRELVVLNVKVDSDIIYGKKGIHAGKPHGTPCDHASKSSE